MNDAYVLAIPLDTSIPPISLLVSVMLTDDGRVTGESLPSAAEDPAPPRQTENGGRARTLYGGRMIACTWKRQLLFMLGFALARNVLAEHVLSREKLRPPG